MLPLVTLACRGYVIGRVSHALCTLQPWGESLHFTTQWTFTITLLLLRVCCCPQCGQTALHESVQSNTSPSKKVHRGLKLVTFTSLIATRSSLDNTYLAGRVWPGYIAEVGPLGQRTCGICMQLYASKGDSLPLRAAGSL
jgi:hypothetical protein